MPISALLIERWSRDPRHECVHQTEYANMRELRRVMADYVDQARLQVAALVLRLLHPAEGYFSATNEANTATERMGKWTA